MWAGAGGGGSAPEIAVTGNGNNITDGDGTPSLTDHTDFGSLVQGGSVIPRTFTVLNTGTATLTISSVTVPTGFTVTTALPGTIAAGGNAPLVVQLDNAIVGTKSGDITVNSDDADEAVFNFAVTGAVTAVAVADIAITGNSNAIPDGSAVPSLTNHTQFPGSVVGGGAVSRTFLVTNPGSATLTISSVSVPSGFSVTEALSVSILAGGNDSFTVQASNALAGTLSGVVSITHNAVGSPYTFAILADVSGSITFPPPGSGGGGGGTLFGALSNRFRRSPR